MLIVGILEWNERFGIRFMRISSEMFPFASHAELGYSLEFARPELSAAGQIAMKYGHRLTMHPVHSTKSSFTIGSIYSNRVAKGECCCSVVSGFGVSCWITWAPRIRGATWSRCSNDFTSGVSILIIWLMLVACMEIKRRLWYGLKRIMSN